MGPPPLGAARQGMARLMKRLWKDTGGAAFAEIALGLALAGAAVIVASIGLNGAIEQAVATDVAVEAGTVESVER